MIKTDVSELRNDEYPAYTIYSLVNLKNQKRYIGRTKNPRQRIKQHFAGLKSHHHPNALLNEDANCDFGYEILETSVPIHLGKKKERDYITRYKTYEKEYGYNAKDHCVSTILNPPKTEVKPTTFYEEMSVNVKKIQRLREQKGITQKELAKLIGATSRSTICNFEKEKRNCRLGTLNRIARALGCSPLSLIEIREVEVEERGS